MAVKDDRRELLAGSADQPPSSRKKGPSRLYFSIFSFFFLVVVLISVISLGSFGVKQNDFTKIKGELNPPDHYCILFSRNVGYDNIRDRVIIELSTFGLCAFVLWGQVSVLIASVVWLVYFIVLTIFGARIISLMRILDFIVLLLTFLISMSVSVTLNVGLSQTCTAWSSKQIGCPGLFYSPDPDNVIEFYDTLLVSQNSSWASTGIFLFLTIWTAVLMVVYFRRLIRRR